MKNIVLIGMPASGKSTLGVILAKVLGIQFIDTDIEIQRKQGRLLQDIINSEGIEGLLKIEEATVSELNEENSIIATGGSVVYSQKAMERLKREGIVLYLQVKYEEIEERLKNITTRGIVMKKGQSIRGLFEERVPLYEKHADIIIKCSGRDIEQTIKEVLAALKKIRN